MKLPLAFILLLLSIGANAQRVGGSCEGCEAIFEFGSKKLSWIETLPDFKEPGS